MRVFIALLATTLVALGGCTFAGATDAVAKKPVPATHSDQGNTSAESFVWYDGEQQRTVWLDPHVVAEFDPPATGKSVVKRVFPKAKKISHSRLVVRFWRLNKGVKTKSSMMRMDRMAPRAKVSPVFHDAHSSVGPKRALPGNIIVHFNPGWDQSTIERWLRDQQLKIVKKASFGDNVYLIKTAAGLEALETANRLYESGEVVAASPNWWVEVEAR